VLFEGVNIDTYKPLKDFKSNSINLGEMKESFAFLHCGMWLQGDIGEDRKNIGMTIKVFLETFKNKMNPPALLLKVSQGTSSYMGRDAILEKIEKIKALQTSAEAQERALAEAAVRESELATAAEEATRRVRLLSGDAAKGCTVDELSELHATLLTALERVGSQQRRLHEDLVKERRCVICMERPALVLLRPCNHLCLCRTCATGLMTMQQPNAAARPACPKCRDNIVDTLSVFS
jgi:hypothetical protein